MKSAKKLFSEAAIREMRAEIEAAGGNEVFFIGNTDDNRIVTKVIPLAHGNEASVPAITQLARPGDVVIHNHPSGPLSPSSADISIASSIGQAGVAFYIVNNAVSKVYEVVVAFEREKLHPLDIEKLSGLLMPRGPIARKLPKYEHREQQIEMMRAVARAFNERGIAAIEAGTGTGKTFAYLVPVISWITQNKERVVVSTNTINLQEQLMTKDIPVLLSALKSNCKAVLVKGRGNYVCRRKIAMLEKEFDVLAAPDEREVLRSIMEWAKHTKDGTRSDLNFVPQADVWDKVNAESDTCLRVRCAHYNECFLNRARREAASADLLVVNHHLLFADLALRGLTDSDMAILPGYKRVILDEAHNIEDSATSYFGARVTRIGLLRLLGRLHNRKTPAEDGGQLAVLKTRLLRLAQADDRLDEIVVDIQDDLIPLKHHLENLVAEAFDAIHLAALAKAKQSDGEIKLRIGNDFHCDQDWNEQFKPPVQNMLRELRTLVSRLKILLKKLEPIKCDDNEDFLDIRIELQALANRIDVAAANVEDVLFGEGFERIRWIETYTGRKAHIVRLFSVPLAVGPVLAEKVYSRFPTVILTSATLTVDNRFDFLAERVGLDHTDSERLQFLMLSSPFDYETQALIGVPTDIPVVKDPKYREALVDSVFRCLSISQGRAFVLFTSFRMLESVYWQLGPSLEKSLGINVLRQGDDNRTALLERFRRDTTSALFATLSFWEGVDVEGEALECIVLVKLPFKVPDEPVTQARAEAIERRGGNSFTEYSVPLAVIKFKQGFGRLIRNRADHGAVLILDKRVVEKNYGRTFLNSLPTCRITRGSSDEVFAEFQKFFDSFRRKRSAELPA
ncbi:MAG: ATP-dependent DNA helicase DinG [Candidatus Abyssubacteria bacterium]